MEPTSSHCIRCGEHYRIAVAVETGSFDADVLCSRSCSEKLNAKLQAQALAFIQDKYPELSDYVIKKKDAFSLNPSVESLGNGVVQLTGVGGITSLAGVLREYMFQQFKMTKAAFRELSNMGAANVNKTQERPERDKTEHSLIAHSGRATGAGIRESFGVAAVEKAVDAVAEKCAPLANPEE